MRKFALWMFVMLCAVLLTGCKSGAETAPESTGKPAQNKPAIPEKLQVNEQGIPIVKVFQLDEETIDEMDIET